ncbi:cob(I)yrinic acid a,c-diamide adenosyltransferase [Patescibacteria group bacterium]|nr:cob(I)yrinic acid a,c-diamide adenosyltransferase [Patescibacteria group bacterium]
MQYHKFPEGKFNPKEDLGYIQVYTGEGKGKTTAALGQMMRALGQGYTVLMIQFLKGAKDLGEYKFAQEKGNKMEIVQFSLPEPVDFNNPSTQDKYLAEQGLDYARQAMVYKRPDLLVLDEINPAMHHGLLSVNDVIQFLDNKHQQTEVILTGKYAHPEVIEMADLVTIMEPHKHFYREGFRARPGMEI